MGGISDLPRRRSVGCLPAGLAGPEGDGKDDDNHIDKDEDADVDNDDGDCDDTNDDDDGTIAAPDAATTAELAASPHGLVGQVRPQVVPLPHLRSVHWRVQCAVCSVQCALFPHHK